MGREPLDEGALLADHGGQPQAVRGSGFAATEVATRAREDDGGRPFREGPARALGNFQRPDPAPPPRLAPR